MTYSFPEGATISYADSTGFAAAKTDTGGISFNPRARRGARAELRVQVLLR